MKIIKSKYIITCNDEFEILENKALVFNENILDVGDFDKLRLTYKNAEILDFGNDIIMPGFLNLHTHLEFSANKGQLSYGDFLDWLKSIINLREELSDEAIGAIIKNSITDMLKSGVTTIGEISSFGKDLEICATSNARFIFFTEILGSNEEYLDKNWENFLNRLEISKSFKSDTFIPAISVHSPYSTHKKLAKKAALLASENSFLLSTHFLENIYEKEWLEKGSGKFKNWLGNFSKNPSPFYSNPNEFIEIFDNVTTLFTHCVFADKYFCKFNKNLHSITHCPRSNRLLGNKKLNLDPILSNDLSLNIATDGLSSNYSLNFFDELRAALFTHSNVDLLNLAKILILGSTKNPANSARLNLGVLQKGKIADIAVYNAINVSYKDDIPLQLILHTKEVKKLFIKGKECIF